MITLMQVDEAVMIPGLNLLTVAVNNTLTDVTLPQGELVRKDDPDMYPEGYTTMETFFDFFNYAGIHRSVILYSTSNEAFISDVTTSTKVSFDLSEAILTTSVDWEGEAECSICLSLGDWNQCNFCQAQCAEKILNKIAKPFNETLA